MADNTLLNLGTGGDSIRDKDRAGVKTQIVAFDLNPAGAESLMAGTMPVSILTDADNIASGTLAAALQTVVLNTAGKSSAVFKVTNTWAGTILFEGSVDGTLWDPINAVASSTSQPQPTTTVNGSYRLTPAAFLQIRANMSIFGSGTATISARASSATGGIFANQILPVTIMSNPAEGTVSVVNSTIVALGANGVFTGTSEDVTNYSSVTVALISDVASATDGLQMQQSFNGTNWDLADVYTIPAATGKTFSAHISAKFFRVVYTNGATLQTSFRLQTIYHKYQQPASTVRPQDGRSNDNDFSEELAFLMGYNSIANAWNRLGITNAVTGGNENLIDRLKVNAALRMIDNAQSSGSKLVNVTGSQALGMDVNMSDRAARLLGILSAGSNIIGKVGIDQTTPGTTNAVSISTTQKATYRASTQAVLVPAITSPNPFFTIYGSATKTIKIQSIIISGLTLTAVQYVNIGIRRYSTAVTGGTFTALTAVKADTNAAAPTVTNLNAYTAIPTAGTVVGDIASRRRLAQSTTAAAGGIIDDIEFYFNPGGDGTFLTLRGVADGIGIYFITAPASTVSLLLQIEFTEE